MIGRIGKKTLSFAIVHMAVAFSVVFLLTGSAVVGGIVALLEPACNTVAYYFHEKVWSRVARPGDPELSDGLPAG